MPLKRRIQTIDTLIVTEIIAAAIWSCVNASVSQRLAFYSQRRLRVRLDGFGHVGHLSGVTVATVCYAYLF